MHVQLQLLPKIIKKNINYHQHQQKWLTSSLPVSQHQVLFDKGDANCLTNVLKYALNVAVLQFQLFFVAEETLPLQPYFVRGTVPKTFSSQGPSMSDF